MIVSALDAKSTVRIPLYAMKIPAGPPVSAEDYVEDRIDLTEYLTPHPENSFLIRVEGESMVDAGINSGDLLVVERGKEAQNGDIVVARVSGQFTVKRFRRQHGALSLVPANPAYPIPPPEDFSVWGVVKYSIHKL